MIKSEIHLKVIIIIMVIIIVITCFFFHVSGRMEIQVVS